MTDTINLTVEPCQADHGKTFAIVQEGIGIVLKTWSNTPDDKKIAELCAAAPMMLEALKRAEFVMSSPVLIHLTNGGGALDLVRSVIAIAEATTADEKDA